MMREDICRELVQQGNLSTEQSEAVIDSVTETLAASIEKDGISPQIEGDAIAVLVDREAVVTAVGKKLDVSIVQATEIIEVLMRVMTIA